MEYGVKNNEKDRTTASSQDTAKDCQRGSLCQGQAKATHAERWSAPAKHCAWHGWGGRRRDARANGFDEMRGSCAVKGGK